MELQHQQLAKLNVTDIALMVVNIKSAAGYLKILKRIASFPVYQDSEATGDIWNTLGGGKDDFFVYDRCGKLVEYIPVLRMYNENYSAKIMEATSLAHNSSGCLKKCEEETTTPASLPEELTTTKQSEEEEEEEEREKETTTTDNSPEEEEEEGDEEDNEGDEVVEEEEEEGEEAYNEEPEGGEDGVKDLMGNNKTGGHEN